MKLSLSKVFFTGIIIQLLATQGILTFNFFKLFGLWELKTYLHPLGVIIVITTWALGKTQSRSFKLKISDFLLLGYFLLTFIILLFNATSLKGIYLSTREVFMIYILIIIYAEFKMPIIQWHKILRLIYVFVLINLGLVLLNHVLGPEEYMKLLTGRFIWPLDPEYMFKISTFSSFIRSPGMVGESASMAYFSLFALFLFLRDEKYSKKIIFPILLLAISFTRSAYLVFAIFMLLKLLTQKKVYNYFEQLLPYLMSLLLIISGIAYSLGFLSTSSFFERITLWGQNLGGDLNWLFGGKIGMSGAAMRGEGFIATIDNYWLLMLYSSGLLGVFLTLFFLWEKVLNDNQLKMILIGLVISGFFVTYTQSISFLVLFPMMFLTVTKNKIGANDR